MVSDDLFECEPEGELTEEEWMVTPSPGHLTPDSVNRERDSEQFRSNLAGNPDVVIVTHTDADGLTSAALLSEAVDTDNSVIQTVGYQDAYRFEHVLSDLLNAPRNFEKRGTTLLVSDFNPDSEDCVGPLNRLIDNGVHIEWFDHHQWDDDLRAAVENVLADLTIDTDECAASIILREADHEWLAKHQDLAECTKDIDLWIRDDLPRSARLNTYARVASPSEYVNTVLKHGANLPESALDRIKEREKHNERLEEAAVERADVTYVYGDRQYDVAYTYTRSGRTSEIGNHLCEELDNHIAVVARPPSGMSIYSHSDGEYFDRCHEVASRFGGGGHPTASGFGAPVESGRELAEFWATAGESVKEDVLDGVREVVNE